MQFLLGGQWCNISFQYFNNFLVFDTELFCGESDKSILVKVNAKRIDAGDENVYSEIKLKNESESNCFH